MTILKACTKKSGNLLKAPRLLDWLSRLYYFKFDLFSVLSTFTFSFVDSAGVFFFSFGSASQHYLILFK